MNTDYSNVMMKVNCLTADLDSLYHQAAQKLGISDTALFVLYLICEKGGKCSLVEIRAATGITKQTLNSVLRKLETDKIVTLEKQDGRSKNVCLTDAGVDYAERTVMRLFNAESGVFSTWTESSIDTYLNLMQRYNDDFRKQIERM